MRWLADRLILKALACIAFKSSFINCVMCDAMAVRASPGFLAAVGFCKLAATSIAVRKSGSKSIEGTISWLALAAVSRLESDDHTSLKNAANAAGRTAGEMYGNLAPDTETYNLPREAAMSSAIARALQASLGVAAALAAAR